MSKSSPDRPDKSKIVIRELIESDLESCVQLFFDTIHSVNAKDYTDKQLDAWAPATTKATDPRWQTILDHIACVAEISRTFVGFGDMTKEGYLDRLFVHHDYQGMGIASAIVKELEGQVRKREIKEISTHASITAKPFFESLGYVVCKQQEVYVDGIKLINFIMKKALK